MKKLLAILKQINHKYILSVIFIIYIFCMGTDMFPAVLINVGDFLRKDKSLENIIVTRDYVNKDFQNMLNFKPNFTFGGVEYIINKGSYINLNGLIARIMGQRYMNTRVKLDNGHLTYIVDKTDTNLSAVQMTKLYDKQKENGRHFLFVMAPMQIPKYENILPAGYYDYSNQNADELLEKLKENNVPFLDLREEMLKDGINHADAFFKTDHHWKPEAGFWAYTKIVDYFVKSEIIEPVDLKYTDINEYNIEIYKNWFLGSAGKRTGSYYAGVDDFSIITPKFETDGMSVEIPAIPINKKGNFTEVAYSLDRNRKDYFLASPYTTYGHGDWEFKRYRNANAPISLKIMSIGDSFSNVPFTFLSLIFTLCDEWDMRHYKHDFNEYYSEYNPSIVIVLITPASLPDANTTYDFFGDLNE